MASESRQAGPIEYVQILTCFRFDLEVDLWDKLNRKYGNWNNFWIFG